MANGCNIPLEVDGISPIALDVDSPDAMALYVGMEIKQGGGGAVNSVNGKTGNVVLDAEDVGALPDSYTAPVQSVNGKTGAVVLDAADVGAGTYSKPSGGIPASDLASAVQTSLGKADTALQSAPVTSVNGQTGAVSLSIPSTAADVGAAPAVTEVTISTSGAVSQSLDAGKIYHFTGALSALTISFNAAASGVLPQYHFDFTSGSTAATLTLPNGVVMPDGFAVEANKRYEVDILNGYGVVVSWATS